MSEAVVVSCPVCRAKLRLRGSVLSKATVPCPKCGTTLDVPRSDASPAVPQHAAPTPPVTRPPRPPAQTPKSTSDPSAGLQRKHKKPSGKIPDPFADDAYGADDSVDLFGGSADDFSGYGAADDPYGSPAALPPRKKNGSRAAAATQAGADRTSTRAGSTRRGGFFSWVGYGILAAVAGIILQTLLGFTNYLWPLLIATIVTGSMVGSAVRFAAGENNGWGPGIVAVLIAAFAIFAGRAGAFSVSPDVDKLLGIPEAPLERIAFMCSDIRNF